MKNSSRLAYQNISPSTFTICTLEEPCEFAGTAGIQANPFPKKFLGYAVGLGQQGRLEGGTGHEAGEALSPALVIQGSLLLEKQLRFMK